MGIGIHRYACRACSGGGNAADGTSRCCGCPLVAVARAGWVVCDVPHLQRLASSILGAAIARLLQGPLRLQDDLALTARWVDNAPDVWPEAGNERVSQGQGFSAQRPE